MPVSKAHIRATTKFEHNNYDKITVRVRKDGEITRETITAAATEAGETLNQYVMNAIIERMKENRRRDTQ